MFRRRPTISPPTTPAPPQTILNDIYEAAKLGDEETILALTITQAQVDTAVKGAGFGGHLDLALKLIKAKGANIDDMLFAAGQANRMNIISYAREHRTDLSEALHGAISARQVDMTNYLVQLKVDITPALKNASQWQITSRDELAAFLVQIDHKDVRHSIAYAAQACLKELDIITLIEETNLGHAQLDAYRSARP